MIHDQVSITVDRPLQEVYRYVSDFENNPKWQAGVIETRKTSSGPIGLGTTHNYVRQFLGRRMEAPSEITEFEPNQKVAFKAASGPLQFQGRYLFEPASGGTKVTFTYDAEPGGLFKLAGPMLSGNLKRQTEVDFFTLKDMLESGN